MKEIDGDELTGLLNREGFETRVKDVLREIHSLGDGGSKKNKHACVILADMDHFKSVNDALGHQKGDDVLKMVASTLRANVSPTDIVARWDGAEFALCIVESNVDRVKSIVERLRHNIEEMHFRVVERPVTMSFGVACVDGEDDLEMSLESANTALQKAKSAGRNRVEFFAAALKALV